MSADWSDETELLLKEWSEKASCFRWLHSRCEKKYRFRYYCFSIPVIILSTLSGTANFGMDSFVPEDAKPIASPVLPVPSVQKCEYEIFHYENSVWSKPPFFSHSRK